MKTTSNGRWPQNIKRWISQQPLIGSSSNFKLKLRGPNQNLKLLKWWPPPLEDNLRILKVEYISDQILDLPQILNLTRTGKCLKWRRPPIEDELKLLKVGYVRNYRVDIPWIPQMEEDLKISKFEYL